MGDETPSAGRNEDINHAFEDIALTEEKVSEEGYKEGYSTGFHNGEIEGFHLGYHRGAELGAEIGFYKGVVETWIVIAQKHEKVVSEKVLVNLRKVLELIEDFPQTNAADIDVLSLAEKIRSSYKRVCSLLKVNSSYPETINLTF